MQTIILDSDVYPQARPYVAPEGLSAAGMLDLNGDGRMEIIVDSGYFEGKWTNVYIDGRSVCTSYPLQMSITERTIAALSY